MNKPITAAILTSAFLLVATSVGAAQESKTGDFATGNMADAVKGMDTNSDGLISKEEYLSYESAEYDKAEKVPTGNMTDAVKAQRASKREAYLKQHDAQYGTYAKNSPNGQVSSKEMVGYLKGPGSK